MHINLDDKSVSKFQMVLKSATGLPGVKIDRDTYLRKELSKYYPDEKVNWAIDLNPAQAGISVDEIKKIAKECINYETNQVSLISTAAGIPGGFAMIGTVPADVAQYFGHILRVLQKLVYLYGWENLYDSNGELNDETMNMLTLFMGVMFGVNSATTTIAKLANTSAQKASKSIAQKALTKTWLYPIVKKIMAILGVKITKDTFAKGVAKIIPVAGGILSGALTYATFKPMAIKLKNHLLALPLADVNYYTNI